jgi:hypothetical protein
MAGKELMPHFEETNEGAQLSYQGPNPGKIIHIHGYNKSFPYFGF